MKKINRTKAPLPKDVVLLDKNIEVDQTIRNEIPSELPAIEIPRIEYPEADCFNPRSFSELQTRAWWMFLRIKVAQEMDPDSQIHVSEKEVIAWCSTKNTQDGDDLRVGSKSYVPIKTLEKFDKFVFGASRIYLDGPDCSLLWKALAGADEGTAMDRFLRMTGLTQREICESPPEFLELLLQIYPPIAFHALAAMISTFVDRFPKEKFDIKTSSWILFENADIRSISDKKIEDEIYFVIVSDPWFKRALTCLHHNSTIARLSVYGLARTDLLGVSGDPKTAPANNQQMVRPNLNGLLHTIMLTRGQIPPTQKSTLKPSLPQENSEYMSLGDIANYWHKKLHS